MKVQLVLTLMIIDKTPKTIIIILNPNILITGTTRLISTLAMMNKTNITSANKALTLEGQKHKFYRKGCPKVNN